MCIKTAVNERLNKLIARLTWLNKLIAWQLCFIHELLYSSTCSHMDTHTHTHTNLRAILFLNLTLLVAPPPWFSFSMCSTACLHHVPVISLFGGWVTASSSSILSNFFPGSSISLIFFSLKSLPNMASKTGDHIARTARFAHSRLLSTTNTMSANDHCFVKSTCFAVLAEAFDIVL